MAEDASRHQATKFELWHIWCERSLTINCCFISFSSTVLQLTLHTNDIDFSTFILCHHCTKYRREMQHYSIRQTVVHLLFISFSLSLTRVFNSNTWAFSGKKQPRPTSAEWLPVVYAALPFPATSLNPRANFVTIGHQTLETCQPIESREGCTSLCCWAHSY